MKGRKLVSPAALAGVAGVALLALGVLVFRGPAEVFTASVDSFQWNCDSCEHDLSVSRGPNYTEGWAFKGVMKPGVPSLAPGDQLRIESTSHGLVAVTVIRGAGASGGRYTTDKEFPPPFGPLTGLIGWGCFLLAVLLLGSAVWAFVRRQASLDRRLSAESLVAGLLCLAPGLWFLALLTKRLDATDYLGLTLLVWPVAAGTAIVLGIRARRREHDRAARRMAATGLGLSIALTVGWPVAYLVELSMAYSAGGG